MPLRWSRTVAFAYVVVIGACGSDDAGPLAASPQGDAGVTDAGNESGFAPDGADGSADGADGSEPDGGAPGCDDGDPCTTDGATNGVCTHTVAPDGTPCNDGLRCTGSDRCTAGVCRGTDLAPHVQARGHLFGFGAAPNEDGHPLNGLGEIVSDEHMLFLDSIGPAKTVLSLVQVTATGLTRLDTKELDLSLGWDANSPDLSTRTTTFIIPLGDDRAAVIGSRQAIEIVDTSTGKIASVGSLALHPQSEPIRAGVGRGSRFYTCEELGYTGAVDAWEVGPTGLVLHHGRIALPNARFSNTCDSLALSPDAMELLVATRQGIERADITDPTAITLKQPFLPSNDFWRVAEEGGFVVTQRPLGSWNIPGQIEVYRRSELEANPWAAPLLRLESTPRGEVPGRQPLGFAFVEGGLAIEWKFQDANGFRYETRLQPLPGGTPAPQNAAFTHRSTGEDRLLSRPFAIARRGPLLVVPPWRTVLRHDHSAGQFTALGQAEASGFENVMPGAADHVIALSGLGVHDVGLQDPDAPSVSGQPLPRTVSFGRWQPGGAHRLAAPLDAKIGALTLKQSLTPIGCFAPENGSIAATGSVNIADEVEYMNPGRVIDLGGALLQINRIDATVRLRWYDAPPACDRRTLTPSVDDVVALHPEHLYFAAGGDASGAPVVVVADVRMDDSDTTTIRWLEREPGQSKWRTVATSADLANVLSQVDHVQVHGNLALVHDRRRILVVRRSGSTISVVANREIRDADVPEVLSEILHFDEELVFATTTKAPYGVVVLRTRDLERVARFPTHGLARSMAETNGKVVFGSANALDVVDSICPP